MQTFLELPGCNMYICYQLGKNLRICQLIYFITLTFHRFYLINAHFAQFEPYTLVRGLTCSLSPHSQQQNKNFILKVAFLKLQPPFNSKRSRHMYVYHVSVRQDKTHIPFFCGDPAEVVQVQPAVLIAWNRSKMCHMT